MVTIYNTPLSTTSENALFGRPGGDCIPAMKNGQKTGRTIGNRFETAENYY